MTRYFNTFVVVKNEIVDLQEEKNRPASTGNSRIVYYVDSSPTATPTPSLEVKPEKKFRKKPRSQTSSIGGPRPAFGPHYRNLPISTL